MKQNTVGHNEGSTIDLVTEIPNQFHLQLVQIASNDMASKVSKFVDLTQVSRLYRLSTDVSTAKFAY
jgi:hypothetical protein